MIPVVGGIRKAVIRCRGPWIMSAMKGQRLYVRASEPADAAAIAALHDTTPCAVPDGFVGKIVGEIVAHAGIRIDGQLAAIECLAVAPPMRRKRVALLLLREIAHLVSPATLVVRLDCPLRDYFVAAGFEKKDGMLQRPSR